MKKLNQQQNTNNWVESTDKSGVYINEENSFVSFNQNLADFENIKAKLVKTLGNSLSIEQKRLIEKL
jgi:hypothetical protein